MKNRNTNSMRSKRPYMMAMVLGTALTALGPSGAVAAQHISEQAVHDISRYCSACWRNAHVPMDRWGDCTQEVFSRLLQRVAPSNWQHLLADETEERREFVRAIDAVRKRTQRELARTVRLPEEVGDMRQPDGSVRNEERNAVELAAENLLSERQNQILQMSFDGWTVQEMAVSLSLPAERVSDEKYKAVRKLREHFLNSQQSSRN